MSAGLPNSSFYRPHFALQIVGMTGKSSGTLFDPCAGWGGRMLGTAAAGWHYVACEPNNETHANLLRLAEFLDIGRLVDIQPIPAETFDFDKQAPVDVVLTSPPYFNLEVYNHSETQSYNQHRDYAQWRDQWLVPLIVSSLALLKDDGISAWNVMNFKNYDLVGDVIATHQKMGWELTKTVGFDSPLANIRKLKNRDVTYIFQRSCGKL